MMFWVNVHCCEPDPSGNLSGGESLGGCPEKAREATLHITSDGLLLFVYYFVMHMLVYFWLWTNTCSERLPVPTMSL